MGYCQRHAKKLAEGEACPHCRKEEKDNGGKKVYAHFLTTVEWFNLNTCIQPICRVFGYQVFLVGSALTKRDFRDVDIRVITNYEGHLSNESARKVVGMMMSEWLQQRTGLLIDLQLQTMDEAKQYDDLPRNALGITI